MLKKPMGLLGIFLIVVGIGYFVGAGVAYGHVYQRRDLPGDGLVCADYQSPRCGDADVPDDVALRNCLLYSAVPRQPTGWAFQLFDVWPVNIRA